MLKKLIKYTLFVLVILFLGYHSVYFRKLDVVKSAGASKAFNAAAYARTFYTNLLPGLDSAIELNQLIALLKESPAIAFKDHSNALGIGNIRYFLVQGEGTISSISEDAINLEPPGNAPNNQVRIASEFVYGNAIRDASALVNLNDFSNTADFNSVSEEINKIIRSEVLPPFKSKAKPQNVIRFSGAIELNQAYLSLDSIEVIPIQLAVLN